MTDEEIFWGQVRRVQSKWLAKADRYAVALGWLLVLAEFGWAGKIWFKGTVCRIYVRRHGIDSGYLTIYEDGSAGKSLQGDPDTHHELDSVLPGKSGNPLPDGAAALVLAERRRFWAKSWWGLHLVP